MKTLFTIALCLFALAVNAQPCITVSSECGGTTDYCGPYELSSGIYRVPFADGTDVTVSNDHFTHCPRGRIDMVGDNGNSIVAAADGWIRHIEDNHTQQCDCDVTFCLNNYVWIEHPNGEWTKYTHMQTNSVPSSLDEGDWVTAGTLLGIEGQVGCASGIHLHFEVAQPIDTNTLVYDTDGGYIDGNWAKNMIPVFCDITGNVMVEGAEYTAAACGSSCATSMGNLTGAFGVGGYDADIAGSTVTASGSTSFGAYSSGLYQAGDYINLGVGFTALTNSIFIARIGSCNEFPEKIFNENATPAESADGRGPASLAVFPDPADEWMTVEFETGTDETLSMYIADITGKKVVEVLNKNSFTDPKFSASVNTKNLFPGLYFCVLKSGDQLISKKFVVQH